MEVLLFFVIPIKIKWMALLDGIVFAIIILGGFIVPTIAVSGVNFGWTMWKVYTMQDFCQEAEWDVMPMRLQL